MRYDPITGKQLSGDFTLLDRLQELYDIADVAKHRVVEFWLSPQDWETYMFFFTNRWPIDAPEVEFQATPVKLRFHTTAIVEPR